MTDVAHSGSRPAGGRLNGSKASRMHSAALVAARREAMRRRLPFMVEAVQDALEEVRKGVLSPAEADKLVAEVKRVQADIACARRFLGLRATKDQRMV